MPSAHDMIITRATEYSIRAVLYLASRYPSPVVSKQEICDAEEITPAFLTKILQPLIRSGLVRSKRGVAGGFALARDPDKITLMDVMQAAEEPLTLNVCLIENHPCDRECTCPVHDLWMEARDRFEEVFSRHSVAELAAERARRLARCKGAGGSC
ncbi:MAG: Rrf2 family transcriptional regulator [Deferrisomatales bacterium]